MLSIVNLLTFVIAFLTQVYYDWLFSSTMYTAVKQLHRRGLSPSVSAPLIFALLFLSFLVTNTRAYRQSGKAPMARFAK